MAYYNESFSILAAFLSNPYVILALAGILLLIIILAFFVWLVRGSRD